MFVAAVAFWLGGFTFYGGVVIPVGIKVLGSHLRQGFITQQVTAWLNVIGTFALSILLWNTLAIWRVRERVLRIGLASTWVAMVLIQIELFIMHPMLDRLIDAHARAILDEDRFGFLHRVYLISSTAQWVAGLIHTWCDSVE